MKLDASAKPSLDGIVAFDPVNARFVKIKTLNSAKGAFAREAGMDVYGKER